MYIWTQLYGAFSLHVYGTTFRPSLRKITSLVAKTRHTVVKNPPSFFGNCLSYIEILRFYAPSTPSLEYTDYIHKLILRVDLLLKESRLWWLMGKLCMNIHNFSTCMCFVHLAVGHTVPTYIYGSVNKWWMGVIVRAIPLVYLISMAKRNGTCMIDMYLVSIFTYEQINNRFKQ